MTTYCILEPYNTTYYGIYNDHIYTYAHFLNQKIRGYDACINPKWNLEAHTSTLKVILGFTSFLGSLESTAKSNMHRMFNIIISCHLFPQRIVTGSLFHNALLVCI